MEKKLKMIVEPGKQELSYSRFIAAPRELVFKAYTDAELIPQWWGPRKYTTIVDKQEARPGGAWRYLNRDADGNEVGFHGVYHQVKAPELLVSTFEFEGVPEHVSMDTLTFEEKNGGTLLSGKSVFQSVEDRDGMVQSGMEEGFAETLDRLEELLTKSKVPAGR
jgi:uncharacterized protein YndB with AHSA1/START domain